MSTLSDLLNVIIPGGVAGGCLIAAQAVSSWRKGATSRQETVLQRWQRLVREAENKTAIAENNEDYAEQIADHWRQRAADLEFLMRKEGMAIPASNPLPIKKKVELRHGPRRRVHSVAEAEGADYEV